MRVYDLSPSLSSMTAVFPGDVVFKRDVAMSFEAGHHLGLSSMTTTLHIGAHADAPSHYMPKGPGIAECSLEAYVGRVFVARATVPRGERVRLDHLSPEVRKAIQAGTLSEEASFPQRFLVWTGTFPDPQNWNSDFASFDPGLIDQLADIGVKLIGLDTPSIDPETSKRLESHATIARRGLAVLEGLCLDPVPEGEYFLVAAPLKIAGADAGPVRALLFEKSPAEGVVRLKDAPTFDFVSCEPRVEG